MNPFNNGNPSFESIFKRNGIADLEDIPSYHDMVMRSMDAEMERLLAKALADYVAVNPDATKVYFYETFEQTEHYTIKATYHFLNPDANGIMRPPDGISSIQEIDLVKFKEEANNGTIKIQ